MPWRAYLLACADGTLYCGVTNDLDRRTAAHNAGKGARYTSGRRPVRVVWSEACADRGAALRRELALKRMSRARKLALAERSSVAPLMETPMARERYLPGVDPGDELVIRATGERALVVAVVDAAGTLLLRVGDEEFQAARDEVDPPWARHAACACCG